MSRVVLLDDLSWPFDDGHGPSLSYPTSSGYHRHVKVDPFPAYTHDVDLVSRMLRAVERTVRIEHRPTIYVLSHETMSRTNGWASKATSYDSETQKHSMAPGEIVLSGKRIPPHPAMTRYLVGHEYGHHVDYSLCAARGVDDDGLDDEYARLRRLPDGYKRYGGGRWHSNVGELIANDFRILVAGIEPDFWPHVGCARPERVRGLEAWWGAAVADVRPTRR